MLNIIIYNFYFIYNLALFISNLFSEKEIITILYSKAFFKDLTFFIIISLRLLKAFQIYLYNFQ
jgi:hypothetical protein